MTWNVFSVVVVPDWLPSSPMSEAATTPSTSAPTIERVGIIGTGTMGSGIAEASAKAGYQVVARSRQEASAKELLRGIETSLGRLVDKGRMEPDVRDAALERITITTELADLAECDVVIEAIPEHLPTKRELFRALDSVCRPDAVLATNTSTFSIIDMAMELENPERVVGTHFFNPAQIMPLVEVGRPLTASDEAVATITAYVEGLGKSAVIVRDTAGFIVNNLLFGYLGNAVRLLELGIGSKEDIDTAMRGGCNFPMGPFQLYDLIGLDVCVNVFDALHDEFRELQFACPPLLRRMVAAGHHGRKTGQGFYTY